jgi:hypothetical protein
MRFLAFFGRHPWLRNGLLLIVAAAVLWGGAWLWTSAPDTVHITITHVYDDGTRPAIKTLTLDRTIHNGEVAQRLQRDLAALPLSDPFASISCPLAKDHTDSYNIYTLTWYRAGLPVEQASENQAGACTGWVEDGVFFRSSVNVDALYAAIDAATGSSG